MNAKVYGKVINGKVCLVCEGLIYDLKVFNPELTVSKMVGLVQRIHIFRKIAESNIAEGRGWNIGN
jgi:hypothetical protein